VLALALVLPGAHPAAAEPTDRPTPDFDADGFADLAVGAPYTAVGGAPAAGAARVFYGAPLGHFPERSQAWRLGRDGLAGAPRRGDNLGWAVAAGDFDADGFTDLAIASRWRRVGRAWHAGTVHVLRGSEDGLSAAGSQVWSQDSPGVGDQAEPLDAFATALVSADFDGDGFADLAIGAPMEDREGRDAGIVHVLYGSPSGLLADRSQVWTQSSSGIEDEPEAGDNLGRALAAGDFDGDGRDDLAIGAPYEGRRAFRSGIVHILYGTSAGLSAQRSQVWEQDSPGIDERAELRDQFGQSLAPGDFDADGYDDLVAGAWWEDQRNLLSNEGTVHVIHGTSSGLDAARSQVWDQDRPGIEDATAISDNFGQALGVGDLDGDGFDDLAVGIPSADQGSDVHGNQGAVHLFYGSPVGLDARRDRYLTQASPGVRGRAERFAHMGESVSAADLDADGADDLVIGIPWKDGRRPDEGAVLVLPGSRLGVTTSGQVWLQPRDGSRRAGLPGRVGWSLTGSRADSDTSRTSDPRN
jgi:hypothetical protein